MIFYFSGTGNSLYVAKRIAEHNKVGLINIAAEVNSDATGYEYTLKEDEVIGFVYPTYAWNAPAMVYEFINKLKLNNYKGNYIFTVTTMGANTGEIKKKFEKALKEKGLHLNSGFSIAMPNNYIIHGDVYDKQEEERLLENAEKVIDRINEVIEKREDDVFEIKKVAMSGLMTAIVNPLFQKSMNHTKPFFANDDCISCGLCEKVCNCHNIKVDGKPSWGNKCTQCLACIHLCPTKAIQYGKGTEKKGRYRNPNINVNEMKI